MYTAIFELQKKLEQANIPHVFEDHSFDTFTHFQIVCPNNAMRYISVVQGTGTYGGPENKLEIMGLLTPEEATQDEVVGYLTAEDVFTRIRRKVAENGC